jgi:hypothetical protein
VLVAGSLRENPADVPRGGLWVVQAPEKADVHALMQTDLFLQLWFAPRCGGIALEQGA